jgi:hypothetical protein
MKHLPVFVAAWFAVGTLYTSAAESPKDSMPTVVKTSTDPYLRRVLREEFALVYRTNEIDKAVFSTLRRKLRGDAEIAEPGQPFQNTDVVHGRPLPWRRLVFAGHRPDLWVVCCEHGGFAYHYDLFVFSKQGSDWKVVFAGQGIAKDATVAGIRSALQSGKFFTSSELKAD